MTDNKGFTLLELLVVLALIALMTALIAPRFAGPLENLQLKTAAKKIAASLRYARSLAVGEKISRVCVFDFESRKLTIRADIASDDKETSGGTGNEITYILPRGVFFKQAAAGDTVTDSGLFKVIFFTSGSSTGGDIVISGETGRALLIHIDFITGMVEIAKAATRE